MDAAQDDFDPARIATNLREVAYLLLDEVERQESWEKARTLLVPCLKALTARDEREREAARKGLPWLKVRHRQLSRGDTRAVRNLLSWVELRLRGREVCGLILVPAICAVEDAADLLMPEG
ncbi:hypothetical protein [Streptomyces nanshensis]|uniref:Uncharacterized protein n=1 Tax=Streptomyces nanshensis TaxID=518642 RepID=A0A1E7L5R2_9ACTN|nr:hypothetical protein [Streptomyces nanshensis]OEV11519.1 hypothetical protein AN218_12505 [Streptomyces nanshensis]